MHVSVSVGIAPPVAAASVICPADSRCEAVGAGVLLNEPDADYPVHEGDLMALALARADDGSPMLLTVPDLLISHPEG